MFLGSSNEILKFNISFSSFKDRGFREAPFFKEGHKRWEGGKPLCTRNLYLGPLALAF